MTEENRMLITKLVLRPDNRVDLFGRGHKYKDMTVFDASDLLDVGIDITQLQPGIETPCRFRAVYELSDKLNKSGNPYKDVVCLEPVSNGNGHKPAPSASVADEAILQELRAIRAELVHMRRMMSNAISAGLDLGIPAEYDHDPDKPSVEPIEEDSNPELDQPAGNQVAGPRPLSDGQARRMFGSLAGPAIREGKVTSAQVNEITKAASVIGWRDTLEKLQALIAQADAKESERIAA